MWVKAIFSSPFAGPIKRISIRQLDSGQYQVTEFDGKQERHRNVSPKVAEQLLDELKPNFKQIQLYDQETMTQLLQNKKGRQTLIKSPLKAKAIPKPHNRQKGTLLQEGTPYPFLQKLGIQNLDGTIKVKERKKWNQINQFLAIIEPVVKKLPLEKLHIVDFGCGRGHLTLALDYLLHDHMHLEASVVGLDLKRDLIESIQPLSSKRVTFAVGDIANYSSDTPPDMVICLHACDKATDWALFRAIQWGAKAILAVPCCQQAGLDTIDSTPLKALLRHGAIKERINALATDAARAELLEMMGYQTDIIEFIETEHTPKNLLIRALKRPKKKGSADYDALCQALNIHPFLGSLLYR